MRRRCKTGAVAFLLALAFVTLAGESEVARSSPYIVRFDPIAREQVFVVPAGVRQLSVRAIGGTGSAFGAVKGGAGATVAAAMPVTPGTPLYVEVGGSGVNGGWNGGAPGHGLPAGAGGGASDVRTLARSEPTTLLARLIVAGGGGAAGHVQFGLGAGAGGAAGAPGAPSDDGAGGAGQPGTQSTGGAGGSPNGSAGTLGAGGSGGVGGSTGGEASGGGGGGGLFGGGGGGGGSDLFCCGGGAGGGSSYAPGGTIGVAAHDTPPSVTITYTAAPATTTDPVGTIGTTTATLTGHIDAGGADTSAHFQYGTTPAYGSSTAENRVGDGQSPVATSAAIVGLQPGTTYHYRLAATNANGTAGSVDRTFTTLPAPPGAVLSTPSPAPRAAASPRIRMTIAAGWTVFERGVRIESLTVKNVSAGTRVKVSCPSCRVNQTLTATGPTLQLRSLRAKLLRRGQSLTISATNAKSVGHRIVLTVKRYGHTKAAIRRASAAPFRKVERCLPMGSQKPRATC